METILLALLPPIDDPILLHRCLRWDRHSQDMAGQSCCRRRDVEVHHDDAHPLVIRFLEGDDAEVVGIE